MTLMGAAHGQAGYVSTKHATVVVRYLRKIAAEPDGKKKTTRLESMCRKPIHPK